MYEMSVGLNRRLCSGLAWLFSRVPGHSDLPAVSMARYGQRPALEMTPTLCSICSHLKKRLCSILTSDKLGVI